MAFLKNKDCMVQAIISATSRTDLASKLEITRLRQISDESGGREDFNPDQAKRNIAELLSLTGFRGAIDHVVIYSFTEIQRLLERDTGNIFIGLRASTDSPPHIQHVSSIDRGWGFSSQGWLDPERVSLEVMTQGKVDVFMSRNEW